jgi:hypothetical protein
MNEHEAMQNQTHTPMRYDDHLMSQNIWYSGAMFDLKPTTSKYRLGYIQRAVMKCAFDDTWTSEMPCSECPHCIGKRNVHQLKLLTTSIDGNIYFGICNDDPNHYWLVFQPDGDHDYMRRSQVVQSFDPFLRNCKTFPATDRLYESVSKYFSDEQLEASRPTNWFDFVQFKDGDGWSCSNPIGSPDFAKEVVV